MRGMRNQHNVTFRTVTLIVASLTFVSSLQAQTGDWQAVKNITPGSPTAVNAQRRYHCDFEYATDDKLVCTVYRRRPFGSPTSSAITISRAAIREVRTLPDPDLDRGALIGAGIGGGTLAVAAAINGGPNRGVAAFFAFLAGAFVGYIVGGMVPIFQVMFQRGKVVYKR